MAPHSIVTISALSIALSLASSGRAFADVGGLEFRVTEQAAEIVMLSEQNLGQPRVKTRRGEVQVWFPEAHENRRLSASGDGAAVTRARLRPGMGVSAVLDIDVGDRRKVDASLVTIENTAHATIVRIPRAELADVKGVAAAAPIVAKLAAAPVAKAVAAKVVETEPVVANEVKATAESSSAALGTKPAKTKAVSTPSIASGGDSKLPMLLMMSAVLALVLGGIKLWQRKSVSFLREPDIEVVATKRLGPGLQLFIVRAFGQEHLLSVNGKSTERIATNELYEDFDAAANALERPRFEIPDEPPSIHLSPSRSVMAPLTSPLPGPKRGVSFAVPASKEAPLAPIAPRVPLTSSQSIAGLLRLREQADRIN